MKKMQGYDSFQRINYLYQISKLVVGKHSALSSYYGNLMVNIGKKNVLKIHPDIKRQICKKCRIVLIENVSTNTKIVSKGKAKFIEWTCDNCKTKKRLPVDKKADHNLWVDKPEAVVEVIQ